MADDITPDGLSSSAAAQPVPGAVPAVPPPSAPPALGAPAPVGFEMTDEKGPNFMVGLAAGVGLGLLAAVVYAVIAIFAEREFAILAMLIGIAVAFGFLRFGRTQGVLAGVVAAVVALGLFFVAIFIGSAGIYAKDTGIPFLDSLGLMIQNSSLIVNSYFGDPLSYLFVALTAIIAFVYAAGLRGRKDASA